MSVNFGITCQTAKIKQCGFFFFFLGPTALNAAGSDNLVIVVDANNDVYIYIHFVSKPSWRRFYLPIPFCYCVATQMGSW